MAVKKKTVEEKVPETSEVEAVETVKKDDSSFFVYLGPNIIGVIQKGSIWVGNLDSVLDQLSLAIARVPQIKGLLISDKTLVEDRVNIKTPGTRLYNEYNKLVLALRK